MYIISKEFTFSYGHRLLGDPGKCGNIHGHTGRVRIYLKADRLDKGDMVFHFDSIKEKIGSWIKNTLDHMLLLNNADPLMPELKRLGEKVLVFDFNPTAERIAEFVYTNSKEMGFPVFKVEMWESETSMALFTPTRPV